MDCNKMLQSIREFSCPIHLLLQTAEVELIECYEMIYKLI